MNRRERIRRRWAAALDRDQLLVIGPAIALVLGSFWLAWRIVEPAPPSSLVAASGGNEGGARYYRERYAEVLARDGVTLGIAPSSGAERSLAKLRAGEVDVAFIPSGVGDDVDLTGLVSLGAVSYAPLWIFQRGEVADDPSGFVGLRVAVGAEESGTRLLALQLLEAVGASSPPTRLVSLERQASIEALEQGTVDVAFLLAPAETPMLVRLAKASEVDLVSLARADAWVRHFPALTRLVLPRGAFDLEADLPRRDLVLVSPTTHLVAREELHPALVYLLLRAAREIHFPRGLLNDEGEFPSPRASRLQPSREAERFYRSGSPLLYRHLPFWVASLVDRLWVLALPLVAIMLPLVRVVPPVYRWRVRRRIYRWYGRLKELELELENDPDPDAATIERLLARLDEIEFAVGHVPTPLAYSENLYHFRHHIDLVRQRLRQRRARGGARPSAEPAG